MISIYTGITRGTTKVTDRSVASACSLGLSGFSFLGSGMSGHGAARPATPATLPVRERNERPTKALEAAVVAQATAYGTAATGAETKKQTQQYLKWAFRGLEPWSDPV
ncbi:hypothetical protein [Streptomyces sp. NPDC047097]|uniref:hypothetical protein n=1 Tax=Streptomyces sp. NPDC047097 TaxID=3155260 RepID=UPI0033DB8E2A